MQLHAWDAEDHPNLVDASEMWLRDRDGYVVVLASPDGEAASS